MEEKRRVRTKKTYDTDFTKPIDKESMKADLGDCFGRAWDLTSKECPMCADRDICCIIYRDKVDSKAKDIEAENGSRYLDEADMDNITDAKLRKFVVSGETTIKELLEHTSDLGNLDDLEAIKARVVQFVKGNEDVKVVGGIVYVE